MNKRPSVMSAMREFMWRPAIYHTARNLENEENWIYLHRDIDPHLGPVAEEIRHRPRLRVNPDPVR
jgi:hypothetical protein